MTLLLIRHLTGAALTVALSFVVAAGWAGLLRIGSSPPRRGRRSGVDPRPLRLASGDPDAPHAVRDRVRAAARACGLEARAAEIELAVQELVGNGLRHTGGRVTVRMRVPGRGPQRRLRVEVLDRSRRLPVPRWAVPDDTAHGRGMCLVAVLCDGWGAVRRVGGKQVWCEFAAPAREPLRATVP
ncbi:ATP-binding protein [Streptomyces sp. IBSNAI002]|uniref:ATP-binding protein n=1 Tax=Streptomyces sp. IBSNAI002 TaxID=3457500 RepID=UPI003FD5C618